MSERNAIYETLVTAGNSMLVILVEFRLEFSNPKYLRNIWSH